MSNFDRLLQESKEELMSIECVQEFLRLKKVVENDLYLKNLDKEMRIHQKKMCENQDNDEIYLKEKSLYESCKNTIESNPAWQNFQAVKEEVYSILVEIKNLLS